MSRGSSPAVLISPLLLSAALRRGSQAARRASAGGFARASLQGLVLRVVGAKSRGGSALNEWCDVARACGAAPKLDLVPVGASGEADKKSSPRSKKSKRASSSSAAFSPAVAASASASSPHGPFDYQVVEFGSGLEPEVAAACLTEPARVVTLEWILQCLLLRRRVDDAPFVLRPARADAFLNLPKSVHRVAPAVAVTAATSVPAPAHSPAPASASALAPSLSSASASAGGTAMRFEVGDFVSYLPAAGKRRSGGEAMCGKIEGFPAGSGGGGGGAEEQLVRLAELRRPRNGHPRELMLTSGVATVRAGQLCGRVLVLDRANFEGRVYARGDPSVFFTAF